MEKIIRIDGFLNKEKKAGGTYPCFECLIDNKKNFIGVFEEEVKKSMMSHIGEWIKVVIVQRPNSSFWNITHFVALAKPEEIPNYAEEAKPSDAVPIETPQKVSQIEETVKVPSEITTRIMHELIDNRVPWNTYEFGAANDRHTIKYQSIGEFKEMYKAIVEARRIIDTKLNPKQD